MLRHIHPISRLGVRRPSDTPLRLHLFENLVQLPECTFASNHTARSNMDIFYLYNYMHSIYYNTLTYIYMHTGRSEITVFIKSTRTVLGSNLGEDIDIIYPVMNHSSRNWSERMSFLLRPGFLPQQYGHILL